jgi:hypothetical protein
MQEDVHPEVIQDDSGEDARRGWKEAFETDRNTKLLNYEDKNNVGSFYEVTV